MYLVLTALANINERSIIKFDAFNGDFLKNDGTDVNPVGPGDRNPAGSMMLQASAFALFVTYMSFE